jgi:hypothetical protein
MGQRRRRQGDTSSPPATIQDRWFDPRCADYSRLNDWTRRLDANSLQLNNGSMAFIASPEFNSEYGSLQAGQDMAGTAGFPPRS